MTIEIGLWAIPLVVTIVVFFIPFISTDNDSYGVGAFVNLLFSLIISLTVWLIYALAT